MTSQEATFKVPGDFPRESNITSLAGAQPKLAVRLDHATGRYVSGQTEQELIERHVICEDLANQSVAKCQRNRSTKYSAMSEQEILERLLRQLWQTGWGSDAEMSWVIRRTANLLSWPIPPLALAAEKPSKFPRSKPGE